MVGLGSSGREESADGVRLQRSVADATDAVRRSMGLSAVPRLSGLDAVAYGHSRDLCVRRFFDHVNPDGQTPIVRVSTWFPEFVGSVGENIFKIDSSTDLIRTAGDSGRVARQLIDGWMASPGHRANIIAPQWTHLGVGIYATEDDVFATQLFGRLVAMLAAPISRRVRRGQRISVALELGPDLAGMAGLTAVLRWPTPERKFRLADGRGFLLGAQPLDLRRTGSRAALDFSAGDSVGLYVLRAGVLSRMYELARFEVA